MTDATREEVIDWCIENKVNFAKPISPPPEGWMWADIQGYPEKELVAIFTNTEDDDVSSIDVLLAIAASSSWESRNG
jgi:hypothetical protein